MNASSIFRRALVLSLVLAAAIAVVGGTVAWLAAGSDGLLSSLLGTGLAVLFSAITLISLIVAVRFEGNTFFAIVLGAWMLKAVLFLIILVLVRDAPFVHPMALFLSMVAAIVGTLAIDTAVVLRARLSHVPDAGGPAGSA